MTAGWTTILDWLGQVCEIGGVPGSPREAKPGDSSGGGKGGAGGGDKEKAAVSGVALISLGFNSIQLIVNDFLDGIPLERMHALIATIGSYCTQRSDTNISFTSIGLLWRVSDYIARIVGVHIPRRRSSTVDSAPAAAAAAAAHAAALSSSSSSAHPIANGEDVLTETAADALMLSLFTQLHALSVDLRSEVRNSAVKTFSSTLVAHGARMRADACIECLQSFQLPLLHELMQPNPERERESHAATSTELGKDKDSGKAVMMMVHHSRDTAAKQWDETRVYALQGAARVMKVYVEAWSALQRFVDLWPRYLEEVQAGVGHRSTEVALAAVNALQEVIAAPSSLTSMQDQPVLWSPVLPTYRACVTYALLQADQLHPSSSSSPTPHTLSSLSSLDSEAAWKHWMKVYTQLVLTWQFLVSSPPTRSLFSDADLSSLLDLSQSLTSVVPPTPPKRRGIGEGETPLQAATLRLIETLTPVPPHQWPMLIHHLLAYITPPTPTPTVDGGPGGPRVTPFTRKALKVLDALYGGGPVEMRAAQFDVIVQGLCGVLASAGGGGEEQGGGSDRAGGEEVVESFIHIVEAGLPAVTEVGKATPQLWQSLLTAFSTFLSPQPSTTTPTPGLPLTLPPLPSLLPPRPSPDEQALWEHLQIAMVGLLVRHVLPSSTTCPLPLQWRLILLLNTSFSSFSPSPSPPTSPPPFLPPPLRAPLARLHDGPVRPRVPVLTARGPARRHVLPACGGDVLAAAGA